VEMQRIRRIQSSPASVFTDVVLIHELLVD
jgi:hypothetical protein